MNKQNRNSEDTDAVLGWISHELRTPLTLVLAWAQLLRAGKIPDGSKDEAYSLIEKSAKKMEFMIDRISDLAAIRSQQTLVEKREMELNQAIDDAIEHLRPEAEEKNIRLERAPNIGKIETLTFVADPHWISRALLSLLSGALLEVQRDGEVYIDALLDGDRVKLTVSEKSVRPPVRESKYHQLWIELNHVIARSLIEMHGGTLQRETSPSGCATHAVLPRDSGQEENPSGASPATGPTGLRLANFGRNVEERLREGS